MTFEGEIVSFLKWVKVDVQCHCLYCDGGKLESSSHREHPGPEAPTFDVPQLITNSDPKMRPSKFLVSLFVT